MLLLYPVPFTHTPLATVCAVRGTIGADYTYKGKLLGLEAKYLAGVSVANLGCYSCGDDSGSLSPRIGAGGNVGLVTGHGQNISANVDVGMYLASGNVKSETELAAGVGYTFLYNYTLRVGTHIGDNDNALTAGAAVRIGRVTVNGENSRCKRCMQCLYGRIGCRLLIDCQTVLP